MLTFVSLLDILVLPSKKQLVCYSPKLASNQKNKMCKGTLKKLWDMPKVTSKTKPSKFNHFGDFPQPYIAAWKSW